MYGYGYRYNSGLVIGAGGGAPFANTYSLSLDGVDDYVDTNSTKFSGASEFSISMWANFSAFSGNNPIVSNWFTGVTNYIIRYSSTKLQFYISTTGGAAKVTEYTFTPTLGIWYNIICVYNGSNISIYINGTQQGTPTAITGTVLVNTNNCLIGERGTEHFNGLVDEVSYFDRFLTPTEITDISTTPTNLTDLNPIAWYRNGDNGSWKSPQWLIPNNENKDKVSNYSFDFDGIDDKVELGTQSLGITGAISVSAWVKIPTTNTGGGGTNIQQFVCEDRTSGTNRNWSLNWRGGGLNRISGVIFDSGGTAVTATTNAIVPNDGNWHHVMFTYTGDTSTDGLKLFVDGIQRAQGTSANGGTRSTTAVVPTIGGLSQTVASMFEGNIDEVSIFNTVVDIADVWNGSGQPIDVSAVSGIVSNYRMGEEATFSGGIWTVPDSVGSNNGTSANMTIEDRIGEAPNSENNAVSFNMDFVDVVTDVPT
jgi:hypothetical protein